ncbi:hypothetical protein ACFS5J_01650 [Flavobacterium chuncheonense]|uniref:Uncharacterized protein n=1 Tax=Flavobacterium chuncheonense TaxID=2026653 RepID=A0ABW5YIB9_9FLAO
MNLSFSQNIDGKWILTKSADTYLVPKINLFEFKDGKLISYDFEKIHFTRSYKILDHKVFVDDKFFGNIEFINEKRFTLSNRNEKGGALVDFVKLEVTKTKLSISEIERLSFINSEYKFKVAFNVELEHPFFVEATNGKSSHKMQLHEIQQTYFIFDYQGGHLDTVIPIREITDEYIEIYGFSREEPYEMKLLRI